MEFRSNGKNEIFFVDGAENILNDVHFDALTSASAHFLKCFNIEHEVDVYISKRSELESLVARTHAYHIPPSFTRENSIVCVFLDPKCSLKEMIVSLAHEMIHVWQVERGDFRGHLWKGQDLRSIPYEMRPWELEAFGNMESVASWFFEDKLPNHDTLDSIRQRTDEAFNALVAEIKSSNIKRKLANAAKIAGAIGLGALTGLG